jgi:SAM-dependent methyltransferase
VTERLGPAFFDDLYAADPDPWKFASSPYEAAKYDATLQALEGRRFTSVLEIGCSIGVLTDRLSAHCDTLLAIDVAEAALDRAKVRVPAVAFERREVPEEFPDGIYDLIVVSEVLYYLDVPAFDATLDAISRTLHGTLLAVHWRPFAERHPLDGDEVHARLRTRFGEPAYARQTDKYNLDRFDACGS